PFADHLCCRLKNTDDLARYMHIILEDPLLGLMHHLLDERNHASQLSLQHIQSHLVRAIISSSSRIVGMLHPRVPAIIDAVADEFFPELAVVVLSFDHSETPERALSRSFLRSQRVRLGPHLAKNSAFFHELPARVRVPPGFQPSFLRRKVARFLSKPFSGSN